MKVLVLTQYFWPEIFSINDVCKNLNDEGIYVEVITGKPNYPLGYIYHGYSSSGVQHESFFGIDIIRVPLWPRGKNKFNLFLNYLSFVFSCSIFGPYLLRGKKFDVILVYAPSPILQALPAIFIGKLKKVPVVLWVQDLWPQSLSATGYLKNRFLLYLVELFVKFIYSKCNLLLVQSNSFILPVQKIYNKTPIIYHPNSSSKIFLKNEDNNFSLLDNLDNCFSIMFTGNIGSAQCVEVILEAATILRDEVDIQFFIVGEGSRRLWLINESKKRNLSNLHLPGQFPFELMPGLMKKASALLLTLVDKEIFYYTIPNKLQAYLASGKPILACLNGEGADIVIKAKAGLAIPAENSKALSESILQLYNMTKNERDRMGIQGRKWYIDNFSEEMLTKKLVKLLASVIKNRE